MSDRDLWQLCQQREIVLLTANRNDEGPNSLEATIRTLNASSSLPVLTIADPELVLASRDYAERCGSAAPESGRVADAGRRRLHALVRLGLPLPA